MGSLRGTAAAIVPPLAATEMESPPQWRSLPIERPQGTAALNDLRPPPGETGSPAQRPSLPMEHLRRTTAPRSPSLAT